MSRYPSSVAPPTRSRLASDKRFVCRSFSTIVVPLKVCKGCDGGSCRGVSTRSGRKTLSLFMDTTVLPHLLGLIRIVNPVLVVV